MLNEILKTLQKNIKEEVPNKLPNKVPNKSELSVLRLLTDNPRLTRIELAEKVGISTNYLGMIERGNQGKSFSLR